VRHEFVPPGQSVIGHFLVEVLHRLRDAVRRKRLDNWKEHWFLHHDNAPSHTSLLVQKFVIEKTFLSSSNHRSIHISFRVIFGCSLPRQLASRGQVSQQWRTSNGMRRPNSERFQKKPSACYSRQDQWSKCVSAKGPYFECD
jgi:hypothetical protein